jgi:tetratricopeptide (TPR) repeat protein
MKNLDLIDGYFENSLNAKERIEFNELIQKDDEFKKEFQFQKDLKNAITHHQNEELKDTLVHFENKLKRNYRFGMVPSKWVAAASLALVLSFGTWAVRNYVFPSNQRMFETFFEPYRNTVLPIVRGEEMNTIEYRAFLAYESGEYHKAINLFNSVANNRDRHILFYKAMSYLSVDKTDEAIQALLPLAEGSTGTIEDLDWQQKAEWYIALAYLKKDQGQKAQFYLNRLKDQNQELRFKQEEAKELSGLLN